ncbi:MAG: J domain-containing protein [Spirochaetales bacterium]|nr:J domain-containing protein [Spirochaetales bacterium]
MKNLDKLTADIVEQLEARGSWSLSRDRILDLLETDIRDVYGLITSSPDPLVSFKTSHFSARDAGELVSLLECLGFSEAPETLWKAGIWIPYEIQIELQELLLHEVVTARKNHSVDYDTFLVIFDHYSKFIRALQVYAAEFFPMEIFMKQGIETLLRNHPETHAATISLLLRKLAGELFRREIIPLWNLLWPIFDQLKDYLIRINRMAEPEPEANDQTGTREEGAGEKNHEAALSKARKIFGFGGSEKIKEGQLKKRYKESMKKYHPDVNPEGLEFSKKINIAYALLLSKV